MRVLVVGGGAREHALCWALANSPLLDKLWCAPGNPGIAAIAECVPLADAAAIVAFCTEHFVDLVVPGPEAPLVAGVADALGLAGIACCGPSAAAARLEGSKSFCKEVCEAANIPTALWERFDDARQARDFVRRRGAPIVVKADGLAAGKGVVVAGSVAEAERAIADFMDRRTLGAAGGSVVIEAVLPGREVSLFALCDGHNAIVLGAARDHKRAHDGDLGPNTGGMGAVSPPPGFSAQDEHLAMERIVRPALAEMVRRGTPFRGILFAGLMIDDAGPSLIEFNVRLGDPEAECLLPRLRSDLLPALQAACDGALDDFDLRLQPGGCAAVVLAARGYPGPSDASALPSLAAAEAIEGVQVFYGAVEQRDGALWGSGGRVLTVSAVGDTAEMARLKAYRAVDAIGWAGGFCRRDIGA